GGSFAGLTAAFELKRDLGDKADITVVARDPRFVFIPSLIWVVPGWRRPGQISFELEPVLTRKGIAFVHTVAQRIDPQAQTVVTDGGELAYDYLVIATGPRYDWGVVPNLGPGDGTTWSVCNLPHAMEGAKAWLDFLQDPGPVVIGSTQGASCFGAEYEVVFNIDKALRQARIRDQVSLTFFTAEPFLGHFGIGGMRGGETMLKGYFRLLGIDAIANVSTTEVTKDTITLSDGHVLEHRFAIVIPRFSGVQAILDSPGIGDERGFVPINDRYQHPDFPTIYTAGVAAQVKPPEATLVPTGVPKTGWMSEVMAKVVAHNIAADITGGEPRELPFGDIRPLCIMDAGNQGMIIGLDKVFKPRKVEVMLPGPWSHWAKLAFERYYMMKMGSGLVQLP
ncbi:MAG TPA: FAD/NAD(P)-binding oxidoreductase, partial [Thermoleophilia bacterium]|nr:FAD/NAD(P)-binding oxidoreductase [Thermoleophilia bacterium]